MAAGRGLLVFIFALVSFPLIPMHPGKVSVCLCTVELNQEAVFDLLQQDSTRRGSSLA